MRYSLCDDPWDEAEIHAIQRVTNSGMYTMGSEVAAYEKEFARRFGSHHAVMASSGSAANLLAIAALVYSGRLERGAEVIVPAVSWSTTYAPLEQFGMRLVFVDIDPHTLNMDMHSLQKAISQQTRMVFCVNLLGNSNQFDELLELVEGRDIIVLEDNCESLGGTFGGRSLGTFGVMGTYSTFYSHHVCTMEGGMVVTDDDEMYEYLLSLRAHGWTRNLSHNSGIYQKRDDSFYESFNFILPGFNLRPLEMEGAVGRVQLNKVDEILAQRRKNAAYFLRAMEEFADIRPQREVGESSWFGFSMVLEGKLRGKRDLLAAAFRDAQIECRPIVAGNFTRNPVVRFFEYRVPAPLVNADDIHDNGLFVGNHAKDNSEEVDYLVRVLRRTIADWL